MRKLEIIAAFAICAAATPAMAQGRGNDHGRKRGWGDDRVPPGQVVAAQHRRNDRDREDNDADDRDGRDNRNGGYNQNGGYNLPNGAVVLPNGQVVYPSGNGYPNGGVYYPNSRYPSGTVYPNGQSCSQITDRNGNLRTVCRNTNSRRGGDEDDRYQNSSRYNRNAMKYRKARKHRDRDGDER